MRINPKSKFIAETFCEMFGESNTDDLPDLAKHLVGMTDFVSMPTIVTALHDYGFEPCSIRVFINAIAKLKGYSKSAVSQAMSIARDPDTPRGKGGAPVQGIAALTKKKFAKAVANKEITKKQAKEVIAEAEATIKALTELFKL